MMMRLGPKVRVYAYAQPVDMRKGFEGLLHLSQTLCHNALCGDLFLFVGKDRRRAKVLYFDGTGLCLFHKRLEKGRFARLWRTPEAPRLELSVPELELFLEGCTLIGTQRLSPEPLSSAALRTGSLWDNRT